MRPETLRAVVVLLVGLLAVRLVARAVGAAMGKRDVHRGHVLRRLVSWVGTALVLVATLEQLGFDLGVLLGAAGLATVAIGFAAQTAASNFVSGLFLMGERPFSVGEVVRIGTTLGEVVSIDLLSVRLRTFDNLLVRIPNETLVKAELTNISHFPIRRVDVRLTVPFEASLSRVEPVLRQAVLSDRRTFEEPRPTFVVHGTLPHGVDVQIAAWCPSSEFVSLKTSLFALAIDALQREGLGPAVHTHAVTWSPTPEASDGPEPPSP